MEGLYFVRSPLPPAARMRQRESNLIQGRETARTNFHQSRIQGTARRAPIPLPTHHPDGTINAVLQRLRAEEEAKNQEEQEQSAVI